MPEETRKGKPMALKVGDVVMLKTGGPKMTVNRVGPYGDPGDHDRLTETDVMTTWFSDGDDGWNGPFSDIFGSDALVVVAEAVEAKAA
jgi:hypothetical protein